METKHPPHIEAMLESTEPASLEQILKLKEYTGIHGIVRDPRFARWVRINKEIVNANQEAILKHNK